MGESVWRLAGPRRFAESVANDLSAGNSVVCVMPRHGAPKGLQGDVRARLPDVTVHRFELDALAGTRARVVDRLYEVLALTSSLDERLDIGTLARHPDLDRRLIWVDCSGSTTDAVERWAEFLRQYAAAAREVPHHLRTTFATTCDGRAGRVLPPPDHLLTKRWWWNVVGPLDTAVFVSELLAGNRTLPGFAESVVEIASFDLDLAGVLAESWDGSVEQAAGVLGEFARAASLQVKGGHWSNTRSRFPEPPSDSLAAWDAGIVNAWGIHDPCPHAACVVNGAAGSAVKTLIWRAQVGALLPRIEMKRQELAVWVYGRRHRLPAKWQGEDIPALEVGPLAALFMESPELRKDRRRYELAQWLRRARNLLAHLDVLDRPDLELAERVLAQ